MRRNLDPTMIPIPETITTAQGSYRLEGANARLIRKGLIVAFSLIAVIILTAAGFGFAQSHSANRPTSQEFSILHSAEKAGGKNCRLEWNETQNAHEVICDGNSPIDSLIALWHRAPHTTKNADGSTISDPAGKEMIAECLNDSSLSRGELIACITQPSN